MVDVLFNSEVSPLHDRVPITDENGNPTSYFQTVIATWLKEKKLTEDQVFGMELANLGDVDIVTSAPEQGDILYYNGTVWKNLHHGTTGQFLKTLGASANPAWASIVQGISSGTSFPASPATNDRFIRTDLQIEYYWDGTRWLSTQIFTVPIGLSDALNPRTATDAFFTGRTANPFAGLHTLYLLDAVFSTILVGSGNWSIHFVDENNNVIAQATGITSTNNITTRVAINATFASTQDSFNYRVTENSGTASFYGMATITYRLVGV